jgi:CRISPR/Cas system-associated protein endoribonuclease Cas2
MKSFLIPAASAIFGAGVSVAALDALAQDTKDLAEKVERLEEAKPQTEVIDLKIEGVEKRLDKMEDLMGKMVEIQQQQAINQAKICQATGADC